MPFGPGEPALGLAARLVAERLGRLAHPRDRAARAARRRAPRRPCRPAPRPTSNCGFTSSEQLGARARARASARQQQRRSEMKDDVDRHELDRRSAHVAPARERARVACARARATRGSSRRRACELAVADVDARRRGARPRWSRQSVKPPVEAPTSRQTRPARIDAEVGERAGELLAAARDEAALAAAQAHRAPRRARACRACRPGASSTSTWPAQDQRLRLRAASRRGPRAPGARRARSRLRHGAPTATQRAPRSRARDARRRRGRARRAAASGSPCSISAVGHREAAHRARATPALGEQLEHRARRSRPCRACSSTVTSAPQRRASAHDPRRGRAASRSARSAPRREMPSRARARRRPRAPGATQRAERDDHRVVAVAQQLGLADRERLHVGIERHAEARRRAGSAPPPGPGTRSRCAACAAARSRPSAPSPRCSAACAGRRSRTGPGAWRRRRRRGRRGRSRR